MQKSRELCKSRWLLLLSSPETKKCSFLRSYKKSDSAFTAMCHFNYTKCSGEKNGTCHKHRATFLFVHHCVHGVITRRSPDAHCHPFAMRAFSRIVAPRTAAGAVVPRRCASASVSSTAVRAFGVRASSPQVVAPATASVTGAESSSWSIPMPPPTVGGPAGPSAVTEHFNDGIPLDLGWLERVVVNKSAVERRAGEIGGRRAVKKKEQVAWLLRAITMIDLTTLSGDDTPGNVQRLCAKVMLVVRRWCACNSGDPHVSLVANQTTTPKPNRRPILCEATSWKPLEHRTSG